MKKIITLLTLFVVQSLLYRAFSEVYTGKCGANVQYEMDSETGCVRIFGSGDMYDYYGFWWDAYSPFQKSRGCCKSVIIEEGVTSIGDYAFCDCEDLVSVTLPEGLLRIGKLSFYENFKLESIIIPNSVTEIGASALYWCPELKSVKLPEGISVLEDYTFYQCYALDSINIPNNVTSIGKCCFEYCQSMTKVELSNSLKEIGERAFAGCKKLQNAEIPKCVISIGTSAFNDCGNLTGTIIIPDGIKTIERSTFSGCKSLEGISFPDGLKEIGENALYGCSNLESAMIPNSVSNIGARAFYYCKALKKVNLPDSLTQICDEVFSGCKSIESLVIPGSVTTIGKDVFFGCSTLNIETIPYNVKSIGEHAFSGTALKSVSLPRSITKIEAGTFSACEHLQTVILPNTIDTIGDYAFYYDKKLKEIYLPESIKYIGEQAFIFGGGSGRNVYCMAKEVPSLAEKWSFHFDSDTLYIPSFKWYDYNMTNPWLSFWTIKTIDGRIPIEIDGLNCLLDDDSEEVQILPNLQKSWHKTPTSKYLGDMVIPSFVEANNESYMVTAIGENAFKGSCSLKSVVIGENINRIGSNAFSGCDSLDCVTCAMREMPQVGEDLFAETDITQCTLYVASNLYDKYKETLPWKDFGVIDLMSHRVTFLDENDSIISEYINKCGNRIDIPDAPLREGYTFTEWYPEVDSIMPDSAVCYKAVYSPNVYELLFVVDEDTICSMDVTYGEMIDVSIEAPSKKGYLFSGWSEMPKTMPAHDVVIVGTYDEAPVTISDITSLIALYLQNEEGITIDDITTMISKYLSQSGKDQTEEDENKINGHEFVDLGLSVNWATCNVGAELPEQYGNYYAWGEVEPSTMYMWYFYKWCNGSKTSQKKYCTSSSYGIVDNKTVLDIADDVANHSWGDIWRMPTKAEQDELRNNCIWTWGTVNGVNGYTVTSKTNGNSIFLPATGYRNEGSLYNKGAEGYYWSSTLYSGHPDLANALHIMSNLYEYGGLMRYSGFTVRPVCP